MKQQERRKTEIDAYAKINFSIDITGIRPNGYHEVAMLMQTIPLCDRITLSSAKVSGNNRTGDVRVTLRSDDRTLPQDSRNIARKAAELMLRQYPQIAAETDEIEIYIQKRIPVGGGLGGSSADGAGVLKGMNAHFGLGIAKEELIRLGGELGADVPFQIQGGTALATGLGTELAELPPLVSGFLLICNPGFSLMTREVYQQYDRMRISDSDRPDTEALCRALRTGNAEFLCCNLKNVLESPAFYLKPGLATLKAALIKTEARGVLMSGSGSCIYAIFARESAARKTARMIEAEYGCETIICDISRPH